MFYRPSSYETVVGLARRLAGGSETCFIPGMRRFDGRSVFVSGAASGIGRATAERFGREGGRVACARREPAGRGGDRGRDPRRRWRRVRPPVRRHSPGAVTEAIAETVRRQGGLHVLANVAGIGFFRRTTETTLEEWNRMIAVNLTGQFLDLQGGHPAHPEEQGRHHQHGLRRRAQVAPVQRGVLRVQGRRRPAHAGARGGVRPQGRPHQLRLPGRRGDAAHRQVHAPGGGQPGRAHAHHAARPHGQARRGGGHDRVPRLGRRDVHQRRRPSSSTAG